MANWIEPQTGALLTAKLAAWCLSQGVGVQLVGGEGPVRPVVLTGVCYRTKGGGELMHEGTTVGGRTVWTGWVRVTYPDGRVERTLVMA